MTGSEKNTRTLACLTFSYQCDSNQVMNNDFSVYTMFRLVVFQNFRGHKPIICYTVYDSRDETRSFDYLILGSV